LAIFNTIFLIGGGLLFWATLYKLLTTTAFPRDRTTQ